MENTLELNQSRTYSRMKLISKKDSQHSKSIKQCLSLLLVIRDYVVQSIHLSLEKSEQQSDKIEADINYSSLERRYLMKYYYFLRHSLPSNDHSLNSSPKLFPPFRLHLHSQMLPQLDIKYNQIWLMTSIRSLLCTINLRMLSSKSLKR